MRAAARSTTTAACAGAPTWPAQCAIRTPTCERKSARMGGGMAPRNASCSNLARSRRRRSVTASAAVAGPDSWARRRQRKCTGDQGRSTGTSQNTPARERSARPARNASVADASSITAAVAPKRSTSTTGPATTSTASGTSRRRLCERASRDTPVTYSVVRAGRGASPFRERISVAAAAAAPDGRLIGPAGVYRRAAAWEGACGNAPAPARRGDTGAPPSGAPAEGTGAGFGAPRPLRRRRRETRVQGPASSPCKAAVTPTAGGASLAVDEGGAATQQGVGSRRSQRG